MITLNGAVKRRFFFPADPTTTLIYFSDLSRVIFFLPHINLVETYSSDRVRIHYQTVELGAYTINIYCDLECAVDIEKHAIVIGPQSGREEVVSEATLNATTGYGYYTSSALLFPEDGGTGIDYHLRFQSKLQRPRGLRMMPRRVVDRIAHSVSLGRVEEIAEGFMENALSAFDAWQAEQTGDLVQQWIEGRQRQPAAFGRSRQED
jgi:hypothetical protein